MHKNLMTLLMGGFIGLVITSFLATKIIAMLFTAPVSFGIQCEPVGHWAMNKLLVTQAVGFVGGSVLILVLKNKIFNKTKEKPT
jgi:hypothetical protein